MSTVFELRFFLSHFLLTLILIADVWRSPVSELLHHNSKDLPDLLRAGENPGDHVCEPRITISGLGPGGSDRPGSGEFPRPGFQLVVMSVTGVIRVCRSNKWGVFDVCDSGL